MSVSTRSAAHRVQEVERLAAVRRLADDRERQRAARSRRAARAAGGAPAPRRRRPARAAVRQPCGAPVLPRASAGPASRAGFARSSRLRAPARASPDGKASGCGLRRSRRAPATRARPRRRNAAPAARGCWRAPSCCPRGGGRRRPVRIAQDRVDLAALVEDVDRDHAGRRSTARCRGRRRSRAAAAARAAAPARRAGMLFTCHSTLQPSPSRSFSSARYCRHSSTSSASGIELAVVAHQHAEQVGHVLERGLGRRGRRASATAPR